MDKYGKRWVLWFAPKGKTKWAITLGQTTYYSVQPSEISVSWKAHEDTHKFQWKEDGYIKFSIRYIWQWIFKGYDKIDYEIEARNVQEVIQRNSGNL